MAGASAATAPVAAAAPTPAPATPEAPGTPRSRRVSFSNQEDALIDGVTDAVADTAINSPPAGRTPSSHLKQARFAREDARLSSMDADLTTCAMTSHRFRHPTNVY
jgi:hypothetical protein